MQKTSLPLQTSANFDQSGCPGLIKMDQSSTNQDFEDDNKTREINKNLQESAEIYQSGRDLAGNIDHGRAGIKKSLNTAIEFLEHMGATSGQIKPLNRLLTALEDLDEGTTAEYLKPSRKGSGRTPVASSEYYFRAMAVAVVEQVYSDGSITWLEAEEKALRLLKKAGLKLTNKTDVNERQILTQWRKDIDQNPCEDRYKNIMQELKLRSGSGLKKAEHLAAQIPGILPRVEIIEK